MQHLTLDHFKNELLTAGISPNQKVLVALSGGADSIALAHLFVSVKQPIVLAHCNFTLRGENSDLDEVFVTDFAKQLQCPIVTKRFNTIEYAESQKLSIEMAARELRYRWFQELQNELNCPILATGHHLDDAIETFFLNLNRGTGIRGLMGIPSNQNKIFRPLLKVTKEAIINYLDANNLSYRLDESNEDTIYLRNQFRNLLLPKFEEINPNYKDRVQETITNLTHIFKTYAIRIEEQKQRLVVTDNERALISQKLIHELPDRESVFYEILADYGFNKRQLLQILAVDKGQCGQTFLSRSHRLIIDRHNYIVLKREAPSDELFYIDKLDDVSHLPLKMNFETFENGNYTLVRDSNIAQLDFNQLELPLILRRRKTGDLFKPLGMNGFKKLSDFLIDNKISIDQKEKIWILQSGDEIVWVVNHRVDDRFKVTDKTKMVLKITIEP